MLIFCFPAIVVSLAEMNSQKSSAGLGISHADDRLCLVCLLHCLATSETTYRKHSPPATSRSPHSNPPSSLSLLLSQWAHRHDSRDIVISSSIAHSLNNTGGSFYILWAYCNAETTPPRYLRVVYEKYLTFLRRTFFCGFRYYFQNS